MKVCSPLIGMCGLMYNFMFIESDSLFHSWCCVYIISILWIKKIISMSVDNVMMFKSLIVLSVIHLFLRMVGFFISKRNTLNSTVGWPTYTHKKKISFHQFNAASVRRPYTHWCSTVMITFLCLHDCDGMNILSRIII